MQVPVVMYGCESWTVKKAERQRTDAFELWCWRRLESMGFSRQEYWSGLPLPSLAIEEEKSNYYLMQVRIPGLSWVQPLLDLGIQMS